MKQSTFSAVMANKLLTVLQRYTKGIRFVAVLTMLLTLGIGQAWADNCGFWGDGAASITIAVNGTNKTPADLNSNGVADFELGTVTTSLTIKSAWAKVWGKDQFNGIKLYYRVKGKDASSSAAYSSVSLSWGNNFNSNDQFWQNTGINKTISIKLAPGDYEIEYYFMADAKNESDKYLSNNGGNYHANFTIPSKKLTVANNGNGTTTGTKTAVTIETAYSIGATANEGYSFSKWTASSGASSITIADANNPSTTVTFKDYANDATVTASFTLATYTVKWVVDGQEQATETVDHDSKPTQAPAMDPNDPICGDKFVGWVTTPIEGQLKDASTLTIYATDNLPAITGNVTFYAVFADYEN